MSEQASSFWAGLAGALAPIVLVITDPQYRILWVNDAAEHAFGPRAELLGHLCYEAIEGRGHVCPHCIVARGHASGEPTAGQIEEFEPEGRRRYYDVRALPLKNEAGEIIAWLEATTSLADAALAQAEAARLREALAARESEERFVQVAQAVPVGIAIFVADRVKWVNRAFAEIYRGTPEEMVGLEVTALVAPEERSEAAALLDQILREHQSIPWVDVVGQRKDGTEVLTAVCVSYCVYLGQDAVLGVVTEVSEERRIQAEITTRNLELAAFNTIAQAVGKSLDLGVVLQIALKQMLALTGAEAASISLVDWDTQTLKLVAHRDVPPALVERLQEVPLASSWSSEAVLTGTVYVLPEVSQSPFAFPETLASGLCSFAAIPLKSQDKVVGVLDLASSHPAHFAEAPIDFLISLGTQIGMAISNAQLFKERADSELHYRNLFETVADPIVLVNDADDRFLDWNPSFREQYGYSDAELSHMTVRDLVVPEDYSLVVQRRHDRLAGKPTLDHYEIRYVRKDGEVRNVAVGVSPHIVGGIATGVLVVARDITEQKRLQNDLIRAEKLSALGQLVSGVAHELNNPLTTILLAAEMLLDEEQNPERAIRLEAIIEQVQRGRALTEDLRLFARREEPRQELVDLTQVVERIYSIVAPAFRRDGINIEVQLTPAPPLIMADAHQLEQVFLNLLNNARQAMEGQSGERRIEISVATTDMTGTSREREARFVDITFADTGPGVPVDARARLFDPFYTTKPPGKGTGLGLSVSASIVEAHGGTIFLAEAAVGATFVVRLPVTHEPIPEADRLIRPEPFRVYDFQGLRVLVVDDEPSIVTLLAEMLSRAHCQVAKAYDGREALEQVNAGDYDVVLCDLKMPHMDGFAFFRELTLIRPELAVHTVFMSGDTATAETHRALAALPNAMLEKPFSYTELMNAIHMVTMAQ